jgi:hypothetical protein
MDQYDHGLAQRRLLARARPSDKQVYIVGSGLSAALVVLLAVAVKLLLMFPTLGAPWAAPWLIIVPVLLVSIAGYLARRRLARQIILFVTSDGLTINQRPGDGFSFSDAKLGAWDAKAPGGGSMPVGTALHLQCGSHRFVLGGEDHRVRPGTRLDAAPTRKIDATMNASDFEELLAILGSARVR